MKKIFFILVSIFLSFSLIAQDGNLGLFAGISYYTGELNQNKIFYMPFPAVGIFYRHNMNNRWAFRIETNITQLRGDDQHSTNTYQELRDYSFTTKLADLGFGFEFNFLDYDKHNYYTYYYTPYVFLEQCFWLFLTQNILLNFLFLWELGLNMLLLALLLLP